MFPLVRVLTDEEKEEQRVRQEKEAAAAKQKREAVKAEQASKLGNNTVSGDHTILYPLSFSSCHEY